MRQKHQNNKRMHLWWRLVVVAVYAGGTSEPRSDRDPAGSAPGG